MAPLQEPHRSWPLRLEELWASPLDCQALGDWGAGVNGVSGSWTYVCHGPVGGHGGGAARPGAGKRQGHGTGGVGVGVPGTPARPLRGARLQYSRPGRAISIQSGGAPRIACP